MIKVAQNQFHLITKNTSYIMHVLDSGHLVNLHYGHRLEDRSFKHLHQSYQIPLGSSTVYSPEFPNLNLDTEMLEYSSSGKGDYRTPALSVEFKDHTRTLDLLYQGYEILKGKSTQWPHFRTEEVLKIQLLDTVKRVSVDLFYGLHEESDVITRYCKIHNQSDYAIDVQKIMSMNFDCPNKDYDILTLHGKWIGEGHIQTSPIQKGIFSIDSKKGVSSSNHPSFICLKSKDASETSGSVYGFALVYSGDHLGLVEGTPYDFTRLQLGINPYEFNMILEANESFTTPEVCMTYSYSGLSKMSNNFHKAINEDLIEEKWQNKSRPILFNNWEGTYFDFNEKKLLHLAKAAKDLGIELFVLDDGWFGKRDHDQCSLGDFYDHQKKLPNGLQGISKKIRKLGLDFGIWVEPEMISVDSDLFRKHPEWAIKHPDRPASFGRFQLILDLSNPDVIDYLYNELSSVFKRSQASYVKWDMNRNFSDVYSTYSMSGNYRVKYIQGLYQLLAKLKKAFPDILFESCSSGGNRFDLGMLYYMPQTWTSDNTDGYERQKIQYGMSLLYPPSTMGAHVSGEPSHQVLRHTPLETRFNVAAFGLLGYELDLTKLTDYEKKVVKKQIHFYKEHRKLLQFGEFSRLSSPFDSNVMVWQSRNDQEIILGYYQKLQQANGGFERIPLKGLNENTLYHIENRKQYENVRRFGNLVNEAIPVNLRVNSFLHTAVVNRYMYEVETFKKDIYGDQLMYLGLQLPHQFMGTGLNDGMHFVGDFGSRLYTIKILKE